MLLSTAGSIALLVLVVSSSAPAADEASCAVSHNADRPYEDLKDVISEEEYAEIRKFNAIVGGPPIETLGVRASDREGGIRYLVNGLPSTAGHSWFAIDLDSGRVCSFIRVGGRRSETEIACEEYIDAEFAFRILIPVLEYYAQSSAIEDYAFGLENSSLDDPRRAYYCFEQEPVFGDYPCRSRGITVMISACSAQILGVSYRPPVIPAETEEIVSREEAVSIAREALERSRFFSHKRVWFAEDVTSQITKVIAMPRMMFDAEDIPEGFERGRAYYCWEVPFLFQDLSSEGGVHRECLWVTVDTGTYIGG